MTDNHEKYMRRALALARRGVGKTSPNPAVGCVIVKDGAVVGEGWHKQAGGPHAEVHALRRAGDSARGADVYVTLEPCSHFGKTPPCAAALVEAGVKRVFAGMVDPNPKVKGGGIATLRVAGIDVATGLLETECRRLNEPFIKRVTTGLPFVILKGAMTLDGKIAAVSGDSKWITGDRSRQYVHKIRSMVDAVMVGIGTAAADDPLLTSRIARGRDPIRVIVDSSLRLSPDSRVLGSGSPAHTIVATLSDDNQRAVSLQENGADILCCRKRNGRVDLHDLLVRLGERGIQSVLLEGGGTLAGEALRLGLIDKFLLFYAPKLLGGDGPGLFAGEGAATIAGTKRLRDVRLRRFGEDFMIEGYPEGPCLPA